jgi:hypothetical protein
MNRTIAITKSLAAVLLAILIFSTGAWASQVFIDDGLDIYNYIPLTNPPGSTLQNAFAAYNGQVTGLAFSYNNPSPVLFVAAINANEIFEYTLAGVPTPFAAVSTPVGLAVSAAGNIYTSENDNELVELGTNGSQLNTSASGLAVDSLVVNGAGDVFEADDSSHDINEYSPTLGSLGVYATGLPGSTYDGMAFDNAGDLFVSFQGSGGAGGGIVEISPTGSASTVYNMPGNANAPTGLAFDPVSSNLYMIYDSFGGGTGGADVFSVSSNGTFDATAGVYVAGGSIDDPYSIAVLIPEPGTFALAGFGLISIALFHFRRMRGGRVAELVRD